MRKKNNDQSRGIDCIFDVDMGFLCEADVGGFGLQIQYTPQHLVRLLQIIVDGNCDMGVRQVASIHFKNFIGKNWLPHEPGML